MSASNARDDKAFGGSDSDNLSRLVPIHGGGWLLGGTSFSDISGDRTRAHYGFYDYWIVSLDANGNKAWDNAFGGEGYDNLNTLLALDDGGFLLAGRSESAPSAPKSSGVHGADDFWLVKVDASGERVWDGSFGGSGFDRAYALAPAAGGTVLVAGWSASPPSGNKNSPQHGLEDFWLVRAAGALFGAARPRLPAGRVAATCATEAACSSTRSPAATPTSVWPR